MGRQNDARPIIQRRASKWRKRDGAVLAPDGDHPRMFLGRSFRPRYCRPKTGNVAKEAEATERSREATKVRGLG